MQKASSMMLKAIGEDLKREGLIDTPKRVAKSLQFLTKGYKENPKDVIGDAIFHQESTEMILVKDVEIYSLCEHHMLPFFGKAHIAYIPNKKIIGLSKISRVVEIFTRRLQIQERLTDQIANCIDECLSPFGVAVVIKASHMCMQMRGQDKQNKLITTTMLGSFQTDPNLRSQFLSLLHSDF
ncbi:GTP cyclohydrolase I FolE [bacterium]|nr:GTP cyclohydrolase I FolE [bacterium]